MSNIVIGRPGIHMTNGLSIGGAGLRLSGGVAAAPELDADAVTLIAAMDVEPDATRQTLISDTIADLKTAGVWDELDRLWFMAAHDSQAALLNWKSPGTDNLTAVNAPTFTADRGYAGNGTTSYLNTNFVPSTDGVNYTLNDASMGVYSRTASAGSTHMGGRNATNARMAHIAPRAGADPGETAFVSINQAAHLSGANLLASTGLLVGRRTASNAVQLWRNGSAILSGTTASDGLPQYALYIGASNTTGSASGFSANQFAAAFVGASLTAQQQGDLYDIVQAYMTSVGANV